MLSWKSLGYGIPCVQLEGIQKGLMEAVLDRDENGRLIRKAGVMGIDLEGGEVKPGAEIKVEIPKGVFRKLEKVFFVQRFKKFKGSSWSMPFEPLNYFKQR